MTTWTPVLNQAKGPRYVAIAQAIEDAVRAGELQPGQRLPTHRELARRLQLSVQTVSNAYAEAERRGLVHGQTGRGTFVQTPGRSRAGRFIADRGQPGVIDLSNLMPIVDPVHVEALDETLRSLKEPDLADTLLAYRPTYGLDAHRRAGVQWLRANGVEIDPDELIVTNGASQGVWAAMATVTEPGDCVVTESLTDIGIVTTSALLRLNLVGVATDDEGVVPDALERLCATQRIKALCLTPCYANPLLSLMGEERRERIAEIARRHDLLIVEDDVFRPLVEDQPPPFYQLAPERTYYVTSHTKSLTAALRTGYLAGPPNMMRRLNATLRATGWMANTFSAEIASRWVIDGTANNLVQWQQQRLRRRSEIFEQVMDGQRYRCRPTALHAWLWLPQRWRPTNFMEQARARGLLITPPDPFIVDPQAEANGVRIAFGDTTRSDDAFEQGLLGLKALVSERPVPLHADI